MVMTITPQSFRWRQGADTEDAALPSSEFDQSTNAAPPHPPLPPNVSAATNRAAVVNGVRPEHAGSGLIINLIPDASVASAPAGFVQAIQAAAAIYEQAFKGDNITINIAYGWGTFDNTVDPTLTGSTGAEGGPINGDNV